MKKIIIFLLAICLLSFALVACGDEEDQTASTEPVKTGSGISISVLNSVLNAVMGDTSANFIDNMDGTYVYDYYGKLEYVASVDENGEVTKIEFSCTDGASVADIICSESDSAYALSHPNANRNYNTACIYLKSIITLVDLNGFSGDMTINDEDVCKVFYSDATAAFGKWVLSACRNSETNDVVATLTFSK